jgi:DNA-3-methyladenine glycosylase
VTAARLLKRAFYRRSPLEVAPDLLGKVLIAADGRRGRIVEVEAYGGADDPASHAYRGRTPRNNTMWGPPGHLYLYFTYGMHWCANATCGPEGVAGAVLLRAVEPLDGLEVMRRARWTTHRHLDLCRGPGRLCQALGWDGALDGADLTTGAGPAAITEDGRAAPPQVATPRIGLRVATQRPWRWVVAGSHWASGPRTLAPAPAPPAPAAPGATSPPPTGPGAGPTPDGHEAAAG